MTKQGKTSRFGSGISAFSFVVFLLQGVAMHSTSVHADGNPAGYRIVETAYGPDIRGNDWRVTRGELDAYPFDRAALTRHWAEAGRDEAAGLFWSGGFLQVFARDPVTVSRSDEPVGGGGDVERVVEFHLERMADSGEVRFDFNHAGPGRDTDASFAVSFAPGRVQARRGGNVLQEQAWEPRPDTVHRLSLRTLGSKFSLSLDGNELASGMLDPARRENEGWTHLAVREAGVSLRSFAEYMIAADVEPPAWEKAELLYEESFSEKSLRGNWIVNGHPAVFRDGAYVFSHMSVATLRRRFEGPLMAEIEARALPIPLFSAGVTDAIFIWMMDHGAGDLPAFLSDLPNAARAGYLDLPFYWMDQGGTNNLTTRLRRNPHLRLVRQFSDARRLLEPGRVYRIGLVQHGSFFEYWVDGEPWIRAYDEDPLTEGHIAFRGFAGGTPEGTETLEIRSLRVWRIRAPE